MVLQPPTVIAASVYVVTQTALGHTLEDTLDSFDDWKGHFGIKDDADYNPKEEPKFEAVEGPSVSCIKRLSILMR